MPKFVGGNSNAGVAHFDFQTGARCGAFEQSDLYLYASAMCELYRVAEEIKDHLPDPADIPDDFAWQPGIGRQFQVQIFLRRSGKQKFDALLETGAKLERALFKRELFRLNF